MTEGLFSPRELAVDSGAGYRLTRIEVLNWGTFDKQVWSLTPDAETSLVTGDIGSGKSTLVDALTTLLMPAHRISYNKAAGADTGERNLRSYVEGHYKSERQEASGKSRPIGLRPGTKSYSVILGIFANAGYEETVTLAQVFQQRDVTKPPWRFYVTSDRQLTIGGDFTNFGRELTDLKKKLRADGAEVFDDFPKYSTSFRRLLGIRSAQALDLFHQTVSMKSVGNLNEFVRTHMLEFVNPEDRLTKCVAGFENVSASHAAVVRAREQLEALEPLVATASKYDAATDERSNLDEQKSAVRLFVAEQRIEMLDREVSAMELEAESHLQALEALDREAVELTGRRDGLIGERERSGGDRIADLERLAHDARTQAGERRERRTRFDTAVTAAGLASVHGQEAFASLNRNAARLKGEATDALRILDDQIVGLEVGKKSVKADLDQADAELASLRNRRSNLPSEQIELRDKLCADLGVDAEILPFAGELIDVLAERSEWRGAAERVLRSFALTMLVPRDLYDEVSAWVDGRRLEVTGRNGRTIGAQLAYEPVPARIVPLQRPSTQDLLLVDCLEIKDGPFASYLASELTRQADFVCAASLRQFRESKRSVTLAGQVRTGVRHRKDDRTRIDDARFWVLGWANERKIEALEHAAEVHRTKLLTLGTDLDAAGAERQELRGRETAFERLADFTSWADVDVDEAEGRARSHDDERKRLEAGSSRLAEIAAALTAVEAAQDDCKERKSAADGALATLQVRVNQLTATRNDDAAFVGAQSQDVRATAQASYTSLLDRLGGRIPTRSEGWAEAERHLTADIQARIDRLTKELGGYGQSLNQYMNTVLTKWPELRTEMDATVDARQDYVRFHRRVAADDLPRYEEAFKRQLNTETIQELAGFNNWLNRQASDIGDKVDQINDALGAIPYNPGRYIKLERERTTNQQVEEFRSALRHITDDALAGDDIYSEQRFLDVKRIIERFRGRDGYADSDKAWTRYVTDVRNWFVFSASERDQETHVEWEHYSDSDGKSGGQKEKLAYTILAASLAYQFGLEWGVTKSRDFRFAVIDEAFGRGSDVSTRYALELFAKLGLQLLIVTPLQKVNVIAPYVKAIGFVDNPSGTSSRVHTMTIEDYRAGVRGRAQ